MTEKTEEFDCRIIETDFKRKERFAEISRENWEKIKNHNNFVSVADLWYINNVPREKELGFIIQSEGWKLRIIAEETFEEIELRGIGLIPQENNPNPECKIELPFEEQFPSLKGKTIWIECDCGEELCSQNHGAREKIDCAFVEESCLDKQKEHRIDENEMHDLIIKGICTTKNGLKLNATYPNEGYNPILNKLQVEHKLLEDYKQKVRDAIEKKDIVIHPANAPLNVIIECFKKELLKELEIQSQSKGSRKNLEISR